MPQIAEATPSAVRFHERDGRDLSHQLEEHFVLEAFEKLELTKFQEGKRSPKVRDECDVAQAVEPRGPV